MQASEVTFCEFPLAGLRASSATKTKWRPRQHKMAHKLSAKNLQLFHEEDLNPEGCGKVKRKGNFSLIAATILRENSIMDSCFELISMR